MNNIDYGERLKIGLIYPSSGWVMEPEMYHMAPSGVIVCTTRIGLGTTDKEGLNKMLAEMKSAATLLMDIPADINILACTSASFINGKEYEETMIKDMQTYTGKPFTTTSTSVVNALKALNVKKVALATPYIKEVTDLAQKYLEECGIQVVSRKCLGLLYDKEIDNVQLDEVYNLACEVDCSEADAVLLLCTGLRTIPVIEKLEKKINKPVVSAIQASMWNSLRMGKINVKIKGAGSLFEK